MYYHNGMYRIKENVSTLHVFSISPPGYPSVVPVIVQFFPYVPQHIFLIFTDPIIVQQGGALPCFDTEVCASFGAVVPGRLNVWYLFHGPSVP
jgi:hypothetical protein